MIDDVFVSQDKCLKYELKKVTLSMFDVSGTHSLICQFLLKALGGSAPVAGVSAVALKSLPSRPRMIILFQILSSKYIQVLISSPKTAWAVKSSLKVGVELVIILVKAEQASLLT